MINVTKPFLPDFETFTSQIKPIWESHILTNNGFLHQTLEKKLAKYLNVKDLCLVNSCTNGLLMSMSDLEPDSEVITTPFSFFATTSSILWSKLKPVYCDIDKKHFFINVKNLPKLITSKTKAVLATHVFGNTGDIEILEQICKEKKLRLIFDAAHAFGVTYKNKSILEFGDLSILSFHATKQYHTIEGGAIYSKNAEILEKYKTLRNFGIKNDKIQHVGINSKMSEFHAAMGLCNLKHISFVLSKSKKNHEMYNALLEKLYKNKFLKKIKINKNLNWNYSYYPIIFNSEKKLLKCLEIMRKHDIFPKRYFYPSLNNTPFNHDNLEMKESEKLANRILCLPFYHDLNEEAIKTICDKVFRAFN